MNCGEEMFGIAENRTYPYFKNDFGLEGVVMRGTNTCLYKQLFGNPEESGKLDIKEMILFTEPAPPHRCSLLALSKRTAPISLSFTQ